jgi:hypothetical protein
VQVQAGRFMRRCMLPLWHGTEVRMAAIGPLNHHRAMHELAQHLEHELGRCGGGARQLSRLVHGLIRHGTRRGLALTRSVAWCRWLEAIALKCVGVHEQQACLMRKVDGQRVASGAEAAFTKDRPG